MYAKWSDVTTNQEFFARTFSKISKKKKTKTKPQTKAEPTAILLHKSREKFTEPPSIY